ncbi:MAG: gamma-glutamyl-gamma-aminobutyrate hydrolase family protein, partial [Ornithinimicrobium sp.]
MSENASVERPARVLLIDNVDSFTFNVADLLHRVLGAAPTVWRHDHPVVPGSPWWRDYDAIVVGPGPGSPRVDTDMGISRQALAQREVPVLGVCLGHQGIAHAAGHGVDRMVEPRHGIVSGVTHDATGLFAGLPSPFDVVRYHSLAVDPCLPTGDAGTGPFATAWADDDGAIMGLADPAAGQWGVQFHPESVLTEHGERLVRNFFAEAGIPLTFRPVPRPAVDEGVNHGPSSVEQAVPLRLSVRRWAAAVDPWGMHEALAELRRAGARTGEAHPEESVWLDSSDGAGVSVFADGSGPLSFTVHHRVGHGSRLSTGEHLPGALFDNLDVLLSRVRLAEPPDLDGDGALPFDFRPGFAGYVGYEVKAETGGSQAHVSPRPDAWLIFADRAVVIDHASQAVYALALHTDAAWAEQERWLQEVAGIVAAQASASERTVPGRVEQPAEHRPGHGGHDHVVATAGRHTEAQYRRLIQQAQEAIRAGETYEVCLTNEVTWPHPIEV